MTLWFKLCVWAVVWTLVMSTVWTDSRMLVGWTGFPQLRLWHRMLDRLCDQASLHTPPHVVPRQTLTWPQHRLLRFTVMLPVGHHKTAEDGRWTLKGSIQKHPLGGFGGIESRYLSMSPWQQCFCGQTAHWCSDSQTESLCWLSSYKLHSKCSSSSSCWERR